MSSSRPSFHTASTNSRIFSLLSSLTLFTWLSSRRHCRVTREDPRGFPLAFVTGTRCIVGFVSFVTAGVLAERERELETLREGLDRARAGEGSLLLIEGPAGVGKTALVREARAAAGRVGITPLEAKSSQLEQPFAFGVVRQLLEPAITKGGRDIDLFTG